MNNQNENENYNRNSSDAYMRSDTLAFRIRSISDFPFALVLDSGVRADALSCVG